LIEFIKNIINSFEKLLFFKLENIASDFSYRLLLSLFISIFFIVPFYYGSNQIQAHTLTQGRLDAAAIIFILVIISPVIESVVQISLILILLNRQFSRLFIVLFVGLIIGGLHLFNSVPNFVSAVPVFIFWSATFVIYLNKSKVTASIMTVGLHSAHNILPAVDAIWWS
jgi:hypothetical protein